MSVAPVALVQCNRTGCESFSPGASASSWKAVKLTYTWKKLGFRQSVIWHYASFWSFKNKKLLAFAI